MSVVLLAWAVLLAQLMLLAAMGCAVVRLLLGPRAQDRVLALDTLNVNAAMLLLVFGIRTGTSHYFEAALLITLLGFVTTAALSKFLMRGEVIE
ncbi:K+/H+ antiporter subunit F [Paracraurococcus ruber]|uniref:K+/H+ antiporter subunit F n=1 Tax=Paracraurococcus ruber TaxID=77675 RepID=A0ABS1D8H8_9PROT|nr:K+/H+ antiporter subunit F [Paracraurococcus ruber]MBK1662527.1 K+/H+ antiporter subunit F [Paracraurococcus ruber]TDG25704.1 K+/H+ antiporter subunit F [Paracraurococcus ruber]